MLEPFGFDELATVLPADHVLLGCDPTDLATLRLAVEPTLCPGLRQAQDEFEIFAACEAPAIPKFSVGPVERARQERLIEDCTAPTAAAQPLDGCQ